MKKLTRASKTNLLVAAWIGLCLFAGIAGIGWYRASSRNNHFDLLASISQSGEAWHVAPHVDGGVGPCFKPGSSAVVMTLPSSWFAYCFLLQVKKPPPVERQGDVCLHVHALVIEMESGRTFLEYKGDIPWADTHSVSPGNLVLSSAGYFDQNSSLEPRFYSGRFLVVVRATALPGYEDVEIRPVLAGMK